MEKYQGESKAVIKDIDKIDLSNLTEEEDLQVRNILDEHKTMCKGKLGEVGEVAHQILFNLISRPTHANPYRAGPTGCKLIEEKVKRMLKDDVIELLQSEWASTVVSVSKPNV